MPVLLSSDTALELWVDEPKSVVLNDGYFRELRDDKIDGIAVMIDASDKQWKSSYSPKDIEKLLKLADPYSIEIIITYWPYPSRVWIAKAFADLNLICSVGPIAAIEGDHEFNWRSDKVEGFQSLVVNGVRRTALDLAGDDYVKMMDDLSEKYHVRKEMNTFTEHTENGRTSDIAPHMDCIIIQGYSIRHRRVNGKKVAIPWNHTYGPGHMQKFTLDRTMFVPGVAAGRIEVGYGHAIWDQEWPGHSPQEAMETAVVAATQHPIKICRVRNWSSKWRTRNSYARNFIRSMR